MKIRVADLIADLLVANDIRDVFSVVGGGAMFLNDAFGHHNKINVMYNHHEQASSMAAEGYVRASGNMAAVCVTTGPGGTNALTGVMGAYEDNYPMLVISGQVRYETCIDSTGLKLRTFGEQEYNIVDTVKPMTKYAVMVKNVKDIKYEIQKAIYVAKEGRKGPCWIDIPLNIQGSYVEENELKVFKPKKCNEKWNPKIFIDEYNKSKRPVMLIGSAIRSNNCVEKLLKLTEKLCIPVLSATYNADLMSWDNANYYGGFGVNGGRTGNFIVQNADLIIGMGCRMAFRHIGFNYKLFSPNSKKIIVDIDENELKKPSLKIDVPINEDINVVLDALLESDIERFQDNCNWIEYCNKLKNKFPVYLDKFNKSSRINPYFFTKQLKNKLNDNSVIVLGNSSIAGHVLQLGIDNKNQRIINNMNCGSMGYDLPAAIGAARAMKRDIILITGDGSFQMNIQELQTVVHYKLPIKIFVFNNGGYRAIIRTQKNFFNGRYTGCSNDTGVSIPNLQKVARAYEIPYIKMSCHSEVDRVLDKVHKTKGYIICEVMQDYEQMIEPRIMSKKLDDGTLVSPPIDDLFPFMTEKEYEECQFFRKEG